METSQKGTVESKLLVMWIVWGAMIVSLGIYIAICIIVGGKVGQPMGTEIPIVLLRNILFGVSILVLIATHFIRNLMLKKPQTDPGSISAPEPLEQEPANTYGKYFTSMLVSLALCESIGIYGLILFFLGDSFQTMYTFIIISAAGMIIHRPKREVIEALFRKY